MTDTIAAISTSIGEAGIGIVRMSGKDSLAIGKKVFKGKASETENRKLSYGHIVDDGGKVIDEVLIAFMKGPKTYTRENMVEIYCHGGIIAVSRVLELLLLKGARMAEAGEFTKRAFLNGRLDLSQAEAVIDIIRAKTNESYKASFNQLEGSLSKEIADIRDILLDILAHIEVNIDFSDEGVEYVDYNSFKVNTLLVKDKIDTMLTTADRGKILREGLKTLILGKPNVGKSSLLNAILRENRAIVTNIPGTTRDIIEETVNIDGIPLIVTDTAGIRRTDDQVEQIGVDRAKSLVDKADLIIGVFDTSQKITDEDKEIIDIIQDRKSILILNKSDLPNVFDKSLLEGYLPDKRIITTSMTEKIGLDILEDTIKDMFYGGQIKTDSPAIITNVRHKNQLVKARDNIESALKDLQAQMPIDCIEVDIRLCWENLGEISGDTIREDVLDKIFSEFCIGK